MCLCAVKNSVQPAQSTVPKAKLADQLQKNFLISNMAKTIAKTQLENANVNEP